MCIVKTLIFSIHSKKQEEEKKEILDSSITFRAGYQNKPNILSFHLNIVNEKLT